ncbi:hypothetical protein [Pectobacterium versatile]|uniref:hypothetical protein n=1 Tax=Pectobacterium versatile TaxID=2488639 RepID=UPI001CCDD6FF|nr:hypothetical protein [Pectobacterium versatile]
MALDQLSTLEMMHAFNQEDRKVPEAIALVLPAISPVVGSEALTGSTRLKSGTAQKLVLNMISTGAMVKLGKVYQNLMVDVKATNVKLLDWACRIVVEATGAEREQAQQALMQADNEVKPAILMLLANIDVAAARERLKQHNGYLREALIGG